MAKFTRQDIFAFIKIFRIDIIFLLIVVGGSISSMANKKLIQDKYCITDLKQDPELCLNLEKLGPDYEDLKDQVLRFSATMGNYATIITTPTSVILSLLLGYWLDLHPGHLRFLMTLPGTGAIISTLVSAYFVVNYDIKTIYLLWHNFAGSVAGGSSVIRVGVNTYLARRTPAKYRAARFAILHFFVAIPSSIGNTIGARLAQKPPWFPGGYRNYLGVYFISMVFYALAAIWSLIFLYDAGAPPLDEDDIPIPSESKVDTENNNNENTVKKTADAGKEITRSMSKVSFDPNLESLAHRGDLPTKEPSSRKASIFSIVSQNPVLRIFNDMMGRIFKVLGRKRDHDKRAILWGILVSQVILNIDGIAEGSVDFQFVQKVYHWDASTYANITSILSIFSSICTSFLPALLIHKLHLDDTVVGIIGCVFLMLGLILKGGLLVSWAYILAAIIFIPSGLGHISIQSLISRVVEKDEVGQIFSLMGILQSLGPIVASSIYTNLFNATLSTFPGLYHHITVTTVTIPLFVLLWMDYTKDSWDIVVVRRNSRLASLKSHSSADGVQTTN